MDKLAQAPRERKPIAWFTLAAMGEKGFEQRWREMEALGMECRITLGMTQGELGDLARGTAR